MNSVATRNQIQGIHILLPRQARTRSNLWAAHPVGVVADLVDLAQALLVYSVTTTKGKDFH
jgi:hypothetical protein